MASQSYASGDEAFASPFGAWVRQARESKELMQRQVAAAAAMDQSHYAKVESGKKFPKPAQASAIAQCLGLDEAEFRQRQKAAEILELCGGDPRLAHGAAGRVQEDTAPYLVNKPAHKSVKKLRAKR